MTAGEIAMSRLVFGDAVDYDKVRIHNGEYLWFGLQPDDTAMTPNGEMYFNPEYFQEDFSSSGLRDQRWFMHEMVHVWQHQLNYPVKARGAFRIGLSYDYTLMPGKKIGDFNMEAQGNIIADYYLVKFRNARHAMYESKYRNDPDALVLLEDALSLFIEDPTDRRSLP
ncbi:Rhs element Vgr protein [Luteimonas sp. FCS-9]|nr:Rhs element Vgr protein [Luteimonas sp. FCS-9]